jgi:endonuclease YncB( thermonuclease family)
MKLLSLLAALLSLSTAAHAQQTGKPADCGALPETWSGTAFAIDGDTLAGVGLKPHIRIWGIQAPELRDAAKQETVPGMRARAALADMITAGAGGVSCRVTKFDRYCRLVAVCVAGKDDAFTTDTALHLGMRMLAAGMAYGFYLEDVPPTRPDLGERYDRAEFSAREKRIGLWKMWLGEK